MYKKVLSLILIGTIGYTAEYVPSWRSYTPLTHKLYRLDLSAVRSEGVTYLNTLRSKAGMILLTENSLLDQAAQNHAKYLSLNNVLGHYEQEGDEGFTGVAPADRAVSVGYPHRQVVENLSTGQKDVNESIDSLFSAIYHRFGFLHLDIDEVGIGYSEYNNAYGNIFVYDMGNSKLRELCEGEDFNGYGTYYTKVCADENKKIEATAYEEVINYNKNQNPAIILWPPNGMKGVLPVFYEESPDPLPDFSVSGYPVSIMFNEAKFSTLPTLTDLKIFEAKSNKEITYTRFFDKSTDPNNHLEDGEYALFPLNRLKWGTWYRVEADYVEDNITKKVEWSFKTKDLLYPYYEIDPDNPPASLNVKSNQPYILTLLVYDGANVTFTNFSYTAQFAYDQIDANTLQITATGDKGNYVKFTLSNGKTFQVVIAESDSANPPTIGNDTPPKILNSEQIETLENISQAHNGWSLLASFADLNVSDINSSYQWIWSYRGGVWHAYAPGKEEIIDQAGIQHLQTLHRGEGFWIFK